jgi:hypothetical protein
MQISSVQSCIKISYFKNIRKLIIKHDIQNDYGSNTSYKETKKERNQVIISAVSILIICRVKFGLGQKIA